MRWKLRIARWRSRIDRQFQEILFWLFLISVVPVAANVALALDKLQTMFSLEQTATLRCREFAPRAKSNGLGAVASRFRAAARTEEIGATNLAEAARSIVPDRK